MAFSMTDDELKTRIRNGTPIKILAELNGCSDASIYNWMKKNGITRPEKTKESFGPTRTMSESDLEVLKQIQEFEADYLGRIEDHERILVELREKLKSWQKAEEAFTKCQPD
jgi:hypothetical protein